MWPDISRLNMYLRPGRTDMRKQIYGLASLVEQEWGTNLFTGDLFLFCGKNKRIIKLLYWDRNGFCLWTKRLEQGNFPWPRENPAGQQVIKLSQEELGLLWVMQQWLRQQKVMTSSSRWQACNSSLRKWHSLLPARSRLSTDGTGTEPGNHGPAGSED